MVAHYKQSDMEMARIDYEAGNYSNLIELAQKHNIGYQALNDKIYREKWKLQVSMRNKEILEKVKETKEELAKEYLSLKHKRMLRYEKMIDASQAQQSTTNEGIPLLDVEVLEGYTRAESRIFDISKSCLGIVDQKNIDLKSDGRSIGESFVEAISKMREDNAKLPRLGDSDLQEVMNAEIID